DDAREALSGRRHHRGAVDGSLHRHRHREAPFQSPSVSNGLDRITASTGLKDASARVDGVSMTPAIHAPFVGVAHKRRTVVAAVGISLWLAVVCGAMLGLARYKSTPGSEGDVPDRWPTALLLSQPATSSHIALDRERATVLMFVHARCPCTRAS